ncbi:hypothetical protein BFJ69_g5802 [Fusarium oxysporum]|uniref:Uncharacterized protein n=1 Tax=Fusarium oxysporum TaxID=5507 RepID=A0A420NCU2_FUSOX|nr:hypothetical protein BFJ69_g5802 [Fusarium oxysporum]
MLIAVAGWSPCFSSLSFVSTRSRPTTAYVTCYSSTACVLHCLCFRQIPGVPCRGTKRDWDKGSYLVNARYPAS